jgi:hypothetical protein
MARGDGSHSRDTTRLPARDRFLFLDSDCAVTGYDGTSAVTLMGGARLHVVRKGLVDGQNNRIVSHLSGSARTCAGVRNGWRSEMKLRCKLQARQPESTSVSPQLTGIDTRVDSNPIMSRTCECGPNLWWWVTLTRMACARRQERTSVTRRCLVESLISASTFDSSTHLFRPLHCNYAI